MTKLFPILLSFVLLCCWGCRREEAIMPLGDSDFVTNSTNVVPEMVYMDFSLHYDGVRDKTTARAAFIYRNPFDTLNGARVRLDSWNSIRFNNAALPEVGNSAYYERVINGKITEGDFVWTTWLLVTYTNSVSMRSIDFPELPHDLLAHNFRVPWVGDSLVAGEEASLIFKKISKTFSTAVPQDTAVSVDEDKMRNLLLKKNPGQMFFRRKNEQILQNATLVGGRIRTSYETDCIEVEME